MIDKGVIHGILVEEIEMLKSLKKKTEKEYRGGFDLRIAEADSIKECIEAMSTITEAEIRAKSYEEVFELLRSKRDKKTMRVNLDDLEIRKYMEQLKEE